jgi:dolichol-phosphate mannosyltransferase
MHDSAPGPGLDAPTSLVCPTPAGTLIVVPTFNEAHDLPALLQAVVAALPGASILVVDDASDDGTGDIAAEAAQLDARVNVLRRPTKLGLGTAYVDGFRWGLARDFQRFVEMDADFSHDPRYLPSFMAQLDAGADVVVGSRNVPGGAIAGWGPLRHALSKGGSAYARRVLRVGVRDLTTGFKAYTRRAVQRILDDGITSNGYAFQIETTYRALCAGLRVVEVPIVFIDRRVGHSKMTWREITEAVTAVWRLRRSRC